ncbi:hypothetical protein TWF694_009840 [Orbilia ellipsospora]|uniref:Helix-turn-helix domain-containing protein n=1 Tax=Orbilia ellipsospora TaxID=2528407 RepID=A0AAV9XC16_9PEZI
MGSAASKSSSTARRLPVQGAAKRLQQASQSQSQHPPSSIPFDPPPESIINPKAFPLSNKSDEILKDSQDPHFSSMLRTLGTVSHDNNPTSQNLQPPLFPPPPPRLNSHQQQQHHRQPKLPSSVHILRSREQQDKLMSEQPRNYLDVFRIRDVVMMREGVNLNGGRKMQRKMGDDEIERRLGLKKGILGKLGDRVGHTGVQIRERETMDGEAVEFIR